jgi:hypothetical protein
MSVHGDTGEPRLARVGYGVEERPPPEALRHNLISLDDLECDASCVLDEPMSPASGLGSMHPRQRGATGML